MAILTYNGYPLRHQSTDFVAQEFVRDPSDTDHLYVRYEIRCKCVLTDNDLYRTSLETLEQALERVRKTLSVERKALKLENAEDRPILDVPAGGDDRNGPKPLYLNITRVTPATFLLDYAIECHVRQGCADHTYVLPKYLSNRWAETNSYDAVWLCTRRREGLLVLSSRATDPDDLRGLVTPEVPRGFRRESAAYTLSEDGTKIRYQFVDKEMMDPPPAPAVRLRGRMRETTPKPGAVRYGHIDLALEAPKAVDKADLVARAIRIVMSRVYASGGAGPGQRATFGATAEEVLDDDKNAISLSVEWMMAAGKDRAAPAPGGVLDKVPFGGLFSWIGRAYDNGPGAGAGPAKPPQAVDADGNDKAALAMRFGWVGEPVPGSNPDRGIAPPVRGSAEYVKLVAAALSDPCGTDAELVASPANENTLVGTSGSGGTGGTVTATTSDSAILETPSALYADDPMSGVWEHFTCTNHYTHREGVAVLESTKEGEDPKAVRLHNPSLSLTVEFSGKRTGGPPIIPDPKASPKHWVYTGGTISPQALDVAADGVTPVYAISGVLNYRCLKPCNAPLVTPFSPFLDTDLIGKTLETAAYRTWTIAFPRSPLYDCNPFCCAKGPKETVVQPDGPGGQQVNQLTTGGPQYDGPGGGGQVGA